MAQGSYNETVLDHFTNPRNMGEIADASAVAEVGNPACGDLMKLYLKIENDMITDAKFKTFGCSAAIAASSMTTELIIGKSVDEASRLSNEAVAEALGGCPRQNVIVRSSRRKHCKPPWGTTKKAKQLMGLSGQFMGLSAPSTGKAGSSLPAHRLRSSKNFVVQCPRPVWA